MFAWHCLLFWTCDGTILHGGNKWWRRSFPNGTLETERVKGEGARVLIAPSSTRLSQT
jgi:hypothetical protein